MVAEHREVVATYSFRKAFSALLVPLFFGCIFLFGWYDFATDPAGFSHFGVYSTYALFFCSVCYLLWLPQIVWSFQQIFFDKKSAVWIESGNLIFMNPHFFKVRCSDVVSISLEQFGRYKQSGITILLKDGRKKVVPTGLLTVPIDKIVNRLREICLL